METTISKIKKPKAEPKNNSGAIAPIRPLIISSDKTRSLLGMLNINSQAANLGTLNYASAYNILVNFITENYRNGE